MILTPNSQKIKKILKSDIFPLYSYGIVTEQVLHLKQEKSRGGDNHGKT